MVSLADAKANGLVRYYTGLPCKRGHTVERRTKDRSCVECDRVRDRGDYRRDYYLTNRDQIIEKAHEHYQRNREATIAQKLIYSRLNGDKVRASNKRWRLRHPEHAAAVIAAWQKRNPEKVLAAARRGTAKRRAIKLNATLSEIPPERVAAMLGIAKVCPDCCRHFSKNRPKAIDHVIALSIGGAHAITNFRVICKPCNSSKGPRAFASSGQGLLI